MNRLLTPAEACAELAVKERGKDKLADVTADSAALQSALPDGVKPNEKRSLTTTRKGLTRMAPSRLPDR